MTDATPAAGSDIDAFCSKCKLVLAHVIIAVKGARPARVECKTCSSVHAYRKSEPDRRVTRRTTKTGVAAKLAAFEALMEGHDPQTALRYNVSSEFKEEDVVEHKTFGMGLVTRVLSDKKIEITFQAGTKVLVHAR